MLKVKLRPLIRLPVDPPTQRLRRIEFKFKREGVSVKGIFKWIRSRFREGSSWAAIAAAAVFLGVSVEGAGLIERALVGVAAVVAFFLKDKPSD